MLKGSENLLLQADICEKQGSLKPEERQVFDEMKEEHDQMYGEIGEMEAAIEEEDAEIEALR